VKQTLNIVDAIKAEVSHLEKLMAMDTKVGDTPPGESQLKRIKALIVDLEREIELNAPRSQG
jgi:hypothetical protein